MGWVGKGDTGTLRGWPILMTAGALQALRPERSRPATCNLSSKLTILYIAFGDFCQLLDVNPLRNIGLGGDKAKINICRIIFSLTSVLSFFYYLPQL